MLGKGGEKVVKMLFLRFSSVFGDKQSLCVSPIGVSASLGTNEPILLTVLAKNLGEPFLLCANLR